MSSLEKEYNKLIEQRNKIIEEIKSFKESETVKKYLELTRLNEELYNQQLSLYKRIKEEKYTSCKHILVISEIGGDRYHGHSHKSRGCIKCGLNDKVLSFNRNELSPSEKIMYDCLKKDLHRLRGIETKVACDLTLACAIYKEIKETYPNIDDETTVEYFNTTLKTIRNNSHKDEIAKRLKLDSNYNVWYGRDVYND